MFHLPVRVAWSPGHSKECPCSFPRAARVRNGCRPASVWRASTTPGITEAGDVCGKNQKHVRRSVMRKTPSGQGQFFVEGAEMAKDAGIRISFSEEVNQGGKDQGDRRGRRRMQRRQPHDFAPRSKAWNLLPPTPICRRSSYVKRPSNCNWAASSLKAGWARAPILKFDARLRSRIPTKSSKRWKART